MPSTATSFYDKTAPKHATELRIGLTRIAATQSTQAASVAVKTTAIHKPKEKKNASPTRDSDTFMARPNPVFHSESRMAVFAEIRMNARQEWLLARRSGLGGSDIGAILGLSPYRTPVDVWAEKTGRAPAQEETLQMRFGSYAEEFVAREYSAKTGNAVQRFTSMLHHASAPLLGNVDRLVIPAGAKFASHKQEIRTDRGLECKTASVFASFNADDWGDEGTDQVPASYLVQCATYMALTGCSLWDLAVLFGNQEVRVFNLKRDSDLEGEIIARASEWWNKHIVADVPPEPTCEADIKRLYPSDNGGAIEANPKTLELIARAMELNEQIAALKAELDGDKKAGSIGVIGSLKAYMGEASRLVLAGDDLITWKQLKASQKTDWEGLCAALRCFATDEFYTDALRRFTHTKPGIRRFLIK